MNLIETAKELLQRDEIKEASKNIISDLLSSVLGDPIALARVMKAIMSSPFFIREQLFWQNFEQFLSGIDTDLEAKVKFSEVISKDGSKEDNAKRIIRIIDGLDTSEKVKYMINTTRALCLELLKNDEYFRVCHAIKNCYVGDLNFVKQNYSDKKLFPENTTVYELTSNGLMRQAVIDGGSFDDNYIPETYVFTELAYWVYKYALTFDE